MDSSTLMALTYKIKEHDKPGKIAFLVYELLTEAGYSDEEIKEAGSALSALVPLMGAG